MDRLSKLSFVFASISLASFAIVFFLFGQWVPFLWIPLGLCVFFIGLGLFKARHTLKEFFFLKTTKHGLNMGVLVLLVLVFLVTINFISVRNYKTWDFSKEKVNSLSEQSVKLLKELDADLSVKFFYQNGAEAVEETKRAFRDLMRKYQDVSSHVKLDFIEVNERPDLAEAYQVNKGGGLVFLEYKGKKNKIEKIDEQEITSALVKVTRTTDKVIYFTVGHGEYSLEQAREARGLGALKSLLEGNNYVVKEWAISSEPKLPSDAAAVIIAGPTQGFVDYEVRSLEQYIKSGGNLFVALESGVNVNLNPLLQSIGIKLRGDYIASILQTPFGSMVSPDTLLTSNFSTKSQITKPFNKQNVRFRFAQGIEKLEPLPAGITYEDVVKTNEQTMSYGDKSFKGEGRPGSYTIVSEVQGRLPGMDEKAKEFKAIVSGDADILGNDLLYQNLNRDLILNSIAFLSSEENLISIAPREIGMTQFKMGRGDMLAMLSLIIVLAIFLSGSGITIWLKRRNA